MDRHEKALPHAAKANEARECLGSVYELLRSGRPQDAVAQLRKERTEHPDYPLLSLELGVVLVELKEYDAAIEAFRKEMDVGSLLTAREAAWETGSAYARLGSNEAAVTAYKKALQYDPCCVEALYGLGNASRRRGDCGEAADYYRDALFLKPELGGSWRAPNYEAIGQVADLYHNLGVTLMLRGDLSGAKASLERVLEVTPEGPVADSANYHLAVLAEFSEEPALLASELGQAEPRDTDLDCKS